MKTIALISQKGGSGKTTLCIHLAVASERSEKAAAVIDLDPQGSAATWHDVREGETPAVVSAQPNRLNKVLEEARSHGAEMVLLDTSPNSETASLTAARAADFILIPCRPHLLDLQAITISVQLARIAQKPFAVVLNAVPAKGPIAQEAGLFLDQQNVPHVPVEIHQRAAFYHCLNQGQVAQEYDPLGKASDEVFRLYQWLQNQMSSKLSPEHQSVPVNM